MVKDFKVGDSVIGKKGKVTGVSGVVSEVGLGPKRTHFRVLWSNGVSEVQTSWSVDKESARGTKRARGEHRKEVEYPLVDANCCEDTDDDSNCSGESVTFYHSETEALEAERRKAARKRSSASESQYSVLVNNIEAEGTSIDNTSVPGNMAPTGVPSNTPPPNPLLNVDGQTWVPTTTIPDDPMKSNTYANPHLKWSSSFVEDHMKPLSAYLMQLLPMKALRSAVEFTNINLTANKCPPMTFDELMKWLGLRLCMANEPRLGGIPEYWRSDPYPDDTMQPADYGRFGMTRHRFQDINTHLSLINPNEVSICILL